MDDIHIIIYRGHEMGKISKGSILSNNVNTTYGIYTLFKEIMEESITENISIWASQWQMQVRFPCDDLIIVRKLINITWRLNQLVSHTLAVRRNHGNG